MLADHPDTIVRTEPVLFTPERLFGEPSEPADIATHLPFLERARSGREQERDEVARTALAAYLVARLVRRVVTMDETAEAREAFEWQLESTRRFVDELPSELPDVAHLSGIIDAAASPTHRGPVLRMGLTAYAYFLEHEGRLEEALEVLALAACTQGRELPALEFAAFALFAARLNRLLARWDRANTSYAAAEEAASSVGNREMVLRSRLGRANVLRGQGNLPASLTAVEGVLSESKRDTSLTDVMADAYLDRGEVLARQGRTVDGLASVYQAFLHTQDHVQRMRILGDIGVRLRSLGALDTARTAFEIVLESRTAFVVRTNAMLELMEIEAAQRNRVGFERCRQSAVEAEDRMPPSMAVDYRYKLGVGYARFGLAQRGRSFLEEALALAEQHGLNQWYFRVEDALKDVDQMSDAPPPRRSELADSPEVVEMTAGLQNFAAFSLA